MRRAGLDIGSRSVELVVLDEEDRVVASERLPTLPTVAEDCRRLVAAHPAGRLVVTGYGRALAEAALEARAVTEIKAYARGASAVAPGCRLVVDIGGQDTKAIALDGDGRVERFEMNDRCAAGAGRSLEMMALALGYDLEELGPAGLAGEDGVALSSMCAVFAESEVVGLVTRGAQRRDIARAVHRAIVARTAAMIRRVGLGHGPGPVVFAGGGARNPCLVELLGAALGRPLVVPADPQALGALGAALLA